MLLINDDDDQSVFLPFFPVPHMPTQTSHDRGSPVWLFPVVIGVSVFSIAAVVVFRSRAHHCKRNLAYEQHIDE